MIKLTVETTDLARGLGNALAFIPAAGQYPWVYLHLDPAANVLRVMGTDGYAVGMESVPFTGYDGPPEPSAYLVDKGKDEVTTKGKEAPAFGCVPFERAVRVAGKGPCDVTFTLPRVECRPMGGQSAAVDLVQLPEMVSGFAYLTEVIDTAERGMTRCLDPGLWSRFSKVKADKTNGRMADLMFGPGELDPVFVKIGPNFKGVLMPIDREQNAKSVGEDGLW